MSVVKSLTQAQFVLMESAVVKDYKFQDLSLCIKVFFALHLIKQGELIGRKMVNTLVYYFC